MKELTIEEKAKAYDEALQRAKLSRLQLLDIGEEATEIEYIFPELKAIEDERIRKWIINEIKIKHHNLDEENVDFVDKAIAWVEKQGEQKEINLVEVLKHYPKETELYSPLYGKLWLAEVDEEQEIVICYKHQLENGCTIADLEQEDTVAFYSNGTTGLPDFSVSKDCMLFLYEIKKQGKKNSDRIHITQNIIDYINKHKVKFECDIPKLGDIWNVKEIHKYPGNPIIGLENSEGAWLNLPLHVVYDNFS